MTWRPTDYRCDLAPQWIDYNGHLRDAYYTLVFSQAIDALMDEVGLDEAYRANSACTLFTLETHIHYLHEVKASDTISVRARAIGVDAKRLHWGWRCTARVSPSRPLSANACCCTCSSTRNRRARRSRSRSCSD